MISPIEYNSPGCPGKTLEKQTWSILCCTLFQENHFLFYNYKFLKMILNCKGCFLKLCFDNWNKLRWTKQGCASSVLPCIFRQPGCVIFIFYFRFNVALCKSSKLQFFISSPNMENASTFRFLLQLKCRLWGQGQAGKWEGWIYTWSWRKSWVAESWRKAQFREEPQVQVRWEVGAPEKSCWWIEWNLSLRNCCSEHMCL